jgi:hypothetical protein
MTRSQFAFQVMLTMLLSLLVVLLILASPEHVAAPPPPIPFNIHFGPVHP